MGKEISTNAEVTMTSQEIAELVEARHDNVKRTIERLAERGVIQLPPLEDVKNQKSQTVQVYRIGKRDSYVIVAQLSPEFTARLVDRWQELEAATPQLPQTFAEALRLAADQAEKIALMAPKAEVFDQIVDANNLYNATQIAQKIGKSAIWLNKQLDQLHVYSKNCQRGRAFRQWFLDKGYGIMRETTNGFSQPMFYAKGEMWIIQQLTEGNENEPENV